MGQSLCKRRVSRTDRALACTRHQESPAIRPFDSTSRSFLLSLCGVVSALAFLGCASDKPPTPGDQMLAVGESPREGKLDQAELAAWATVCSVILNLDEAMTRG